MLRWVGLMALPPWCWIARRDPIGGEHRGVP
jgi:hypothetical protein